MSAPKGPRPVTRALEIAKDIKEHGVTNAEIDELVQILDELDASSTHEDSGRKPKRKKAAKRTAKKAGRR